MFRIVLMPEQVHGWGEGSFLVTVFRSYTKYAHSEASGIISFVSNLVKQKLKEMHKGQQIHMQMLLFLVGHHHSN